MNNASKNPNKLLERKVWWRFSKVIYISVYICLLLFGISLIYTMEPYKVIDQDNSYIICNNGDKFIFESILNPLSRSRSRLFSSDLNFPFNDDEMRTLCERPGNKYEIRNKRTGEVRIIDQSETSYYGITPKKTDVTTSRDYTVYMVYKMEGSWNKAVITGLTVAFTGVFLIEIVKTILLYIIGIGIDKGVLGYLINIIRAIL